MQVDTNPDIQSIFSTHDKYWREIDTVLLFQSPNFSFHPNIIIADLDDVLIKKCAAANLYTKTTDKAGNSCSPVQLSTVNLPKLLHAADAALVIISNQFSGSARGDAIKTKLEAFLKIAKTPVLAIFATKNNCFAKPHTKTWPLLQYLYKQKQRGIARTAVIGAHSGIYEEKYMDGIIRHKIIAPDTDRAFAHNIGAGYIPVETFFGISKVGVSPTWTSDIIDPEHRKRLAARLNKIEKPDLWKFIRKWPANVYCIVVFGAPTCGKSTVIQQLHDEIAADVEWSKRNCVEILAPGKNAAQMAKKATSLLQDRVHVIIEGEFPSVAARQPFIEMAEEVGARLIFVEVNVGLDMARVFGHLRVETCRDPQILVPDTAKYRKYRGEYVQPTNSPDMAGHRYILYCPKIEIPTKLHYMRF